MLEIILIVLFCKKNAENAAARGRKAGGFVALTIALWLGMEFLGGFIGGFLGLGFGTYLLAIVMALLGGYISYRITKNCKPGDLINPESVPEFDRSSISIDGAHIDAGKL